MSNTFPSINSLNKCSNAAEQSVTNTYNLQLYVRNGWKAKMRSKGNISTKVEEALNSEVIVVCIKMKNLTVVVFTFVVIVR